MHVPENPDYGLLLALLERDVAGHGQVLRGPAAAGLGLGKNVSY